jgi:hypothetical protein
MTLIYQYATSLIFRTLSNSCYMRLFPTQHLHKHVCVLAEGTWGFMLNCQLFKINRKMKCHENTTMPWRKPAPEVQYRSDIAVGSVLISHFQSEESPDTWGIWVVFNLLIRVLKFCTVGTYTLDTKICFLNVNFRNSSSFVSRKKY